MFLNSLDCIAIFSLPLPCHIPDSVRQIQEKFATFANMNKRGLIITNALLWTFASYKILGKAVPAIIADHRWWVVAIGLVVLTGFTIMFHKVSSKYTRRILSLEGERFPIWKFMSAKGYILIGFMMSMGIGLGHIPGMPQAFFASFYTGLGTGLGYGAVKYLVKACTM